MTKFKVHLIQKAQKDLDKIRGKLYDLLYADLLKLSSNPFPIGYKHMISFGYGKYRIRLGDYRILYDVDTKKKIVYILKIGHRREIYK